jgi:hypothetical protein
LIIVFVWLTYSSKIAEDHRDKYGEEPDADLRFDVKLLVRIISRLPFVSRASQHVLAAAVAVDMLAVSALSSLTSFLMLLTPYRAFRFLAVFF